MEILTPEQKAAVIAMMESFSVDNSPLIQENQEMKTKLRNMENALGEIEHYIELQTNTIQSSIETLKEKNLDGLATVSESQMLVITGLRKIVVDAFKYNNLDYEDLVSF